MNGPSSKGKYLLAALIGAAAGGAIVAFSTRAIPKMMSEMEGKCKQMMAGMRETSFGAGDLCQCMMGAEEQAPKQEACHSEGASSRGSG